MKRIGIILATLVLAVVAGCTSVQPKGDQQAVYAASGSVGSALIVANAYQALNSCAKPAHTLPCSDDATVAKIQSAKIRLVDAYKRADAAVNNPNYQVGDLEKANVILQAALEYLLTLVPAT
jgi:hypothetical protein